jgi:hypothetical protein
MKTFGSKTFCGMMAKAGLLINFHRSALDHRPNEETTAV